MISKRLKIKPAAAILLLLFTCRTGFAAVPTYTVRLGEFSTMPAITEFYHLIPEKYHPHTVVCREGESYILNCGTLPQKKDIQPFFDQFKDMGLNPQIVQMETAGCSPAEIFFKSGSTANPLNSPPPESVPERDPYADLNDPDVKNLLENAPKTILPEVTTRVLLSNRDVNRIICRNGPIKDVVYSQEKGISVKTDHNNAFVKFLISGNPIAPDMSYSNTPSEMYVICGEDNTVYTLIAIPKDIPAQTIELLSSRKHIEENLSLFEGLAFEKKVLLLIQSVYKDDIPESFTTRAVNQPLDVFREIDVLLSRQIVADGEGLILKEYILSLKPTAVNSSLHLDEKFFLVPEITQNPVGIALEHMTLAMGQSARLFVVEKHTEGGFLQ